MVQCKHCRDMPALLRNDYVVTSAERESEFNLSFSYHMRSEPIEILVNRCILQKHSNAEIASADGHLIMEAERQLAKPLTPSLTKAFPSLVYPAPSVAQCKYHKNHPNVHSRSPAHNTHHDPATASESAAMQPCSLPSPKQAHQKALLQPASRALHAL